MTERVPQTLLTPLADLARWLEATRTHAVIVGGVAVSFLGRPRFTQDIDALAILSEQQWEGALAAAPAYGIVPRIEKPLLSGVVHPEDESMGIRAMWRDSDGAGRGRNDAPPAVPWWPLGSAGPLRVDFVKLD